ncbi:hypothetical protein [Streptomyces sp. NPDC029674]|uniref:hypothetical protein n=1 Tax=Streptomyces sp. NPDC029674 TaxID=3365297 RepID=UPI00384CB355
MLPIDFTPDSARDIPAGAESAWQAGRIDLATQRATNLRYGYFDYPVDFRVSSHAFLSASSTPLLDIMFTLAHSLRELRSRGSAEIDFTENSYVIRLAIDADQVRFTSSHRAPSAPPRCPLEEYATAARAFITRGTEYLVTHHPPLGDNPALSELRDLAGLSA